MKPKTTIRAANPGDLPQILAVHQSAFETPGEAELVRLLCERNQARVSLVAIVAEKVVGHVLFSPVSNGGLGLAPLAVTPDYQRLGIGANLTERGLAACRSQRCPFVVVLGDPSYYTRFGFEPAHAFGLQNEYGVKDEFMALALDPLGLPPSGTLIQYAEEFRNLDA